MGTGERCEKNAKEHRFEAVTVLGQPMLFTTDHLDHGTIPKGIHLYAVRHHSEDRNKPIQICQWAVANRYGSLLSTKPIYLQRHPKLDNSLRDIDPDKDWINEDYETTLKEYLYDHPAKIVPPQNTKGRYALWDTVWMQVPPNLKW